MAIVVKLGGETLEGDRLRQVAAGLAGVRADGGARADKGARADRGARADWPDLVVVHGGGPQTTALSRRLGVDSRIVGGRRITAEADLDVIKMIVAGRLNVDLVAALGAAGLSAIGLHGASAGLIRAHRRPPRVVSGAGVEPVDFGLVGDIDGFNLDLLRSLMSAGHVPVLACLGFAADGGALNINADVVASQLAVAMGAEALIVVSEVGGVRRDRDDPGSRIAALTVSEARAAIAAGTVQGGMIPKLEEAFVPLMAGVGAVHIVGPSEIAAVLRSPGAVGTTLRPG